MSATEIRELVATVSVGFVATAMVGVHTHMELRVRDIPPGRDVTEVRSQAIQVINRRLTSLGASGSTVAPRGNDRIVLELSGVSAGQARQVIGRTAKLITTRWVTDPMSTFNGPQGITSGYKPEVTALTGDMVTDATARSDGSGQRVILIHLNPAGAEIFGRLTTEAVNACPGNATDCPQRHITEWLDLTADDVARWDDPKYAAAASRPVSIPGGKLLTNPTIIEPILSGSIQVTVADQGFSTDLALLLAAGAIPGSLEVLTVTEGGAGGGQNDAMLGWTIAGLVGLVAVIILIIGYHRIRHTRTGSSTR